MRNTPSVGWGVVGLSVWLVGALDLAAATNAWTKATSGYWEEQYWSTGNLPGPNETICITNAGFKAVAIGNSTARDYPQTLSVQSIVVSAPVGSSNVFLLNHVGSSAPLSVMEDFAIGNNGGLLCLNSSLRVGNLTSGRFVADGIVVQSDGSDIAARLVWIGATLPGTYVLSNGWLHANSLLVGATNYEGVISRSTFIQHDGTNAVGWLSLQPHADFTLEGGLVSASELVVGEGYPESQGYGSYSRHPVFAQAGGAVVVERDLILGRGRYSGGEYVMHGGSLTAERLRLGSTRYAAGFLLQDGGAVDVRLLSISEEAYHPLALPEAYTYSGYTLSNGALRTLGTIIGAGRAGAFRQYGGSHLVEGEVRLTTGTDRSYYVLAGGTVSSWGFDCQSARIYHSSGTNDVDGVLTLSGDSIYSLSGGTLRTELTAVDSVLLYGPAFLQAGGLHLAERGVQVRGPYELADGELRTSELYVTDTFTHRGGTVTASSTLLAGRWICEVTNHNFGLVNFASGALVLPSGNSSLTFREGSDAWQWQGIALTIENWRGSVQGGGRHQLLFSPGTLPTRTVGLIWFKDPAGFAPGHYPSRLLPSGELVPALSPSLAFTHYGFQTMLSWGANWVLQTATNVAGPYEDIPSASPFMVTGYDLQQQFFRLRR